MLIADNIKKYQELIKNVYDRAFKYTINGKEVTKEEFYKYAKLHIAAPYGTMKGEEMQSTYEVTDEYIALVHKACLFADLCEYDAPVIVEGNFHFYNSPNCRSFTFQVDPATYRGNGVSTIMEAFNDK